MEGQALRNTTRCVMFTAATLVGLAIMYAIAPAQVIDPPKPLGSLKGVRIPEPARLGNFVRDRNAAIVLGKALFWDEAAGSDGQACASCHFHAGADNRTKNQLNPGLRAIPEDSKFGGLQPAAKQGRTASGAVAGPNYALRRADFPFHQLKNILDRNSAIVFDTNDVASSQGTFAGDFISPIPGSRNDLCDPTFGGIFQVGDLPTLKVEPRNTPTTINAVFNFRNFWDGRANNRFNGVSPFGRRDVNARVLEVQLNGAVIPVVVDLENSSLASQAVGPPLSDFEMSCANRTFADLGRKLLGLQALATQKIDPTDSVLSPYRHPATGLALSYAALIQMAFQPKYWDSAQTFEGYSVMEKNFSLFWGLAIQLYEATLVSDDAPIDRFFDGDAQALTTQQKNGLAIFQGKAQCTACHNGPLLTGAAFDSPPQTPPADVIERMLMGDGQVAIYDNGFYNIGVRPTANDIGVGDVDPFGNPFSFTRQFRIRLQGGIAPDPFIVDPCRFAVDPCVPETNLNFRDAVDGAFKTPSLRNVELTGPYFHNGGQGSLAQVVEFYNRGGDRRGPKGNDTTGFGPNPSNLDPDIEVLGLTTKERSDLVAFLLALTDNRVRCEQAPFDHPELKIPNGHLGDQKSVKDLNHDKRADLAIRVIPAAGAGGLPAKGLACLKSFEAILP